MTMNCCLTSEFLTAKNVRHIPDEINFFEEPKFRVNQRAVPDRLKLLESTFKKQKMAEEEKVSSINFIRVKKR